MKTRRFLASFRATVGGHTADIVHESEARIQGSFREFLASQQNQQTRLAFLRDLTGHADPEPISLSVKIQGHFIPIY